MPQQLARTSFGRIAEIGDNGDRTISYIFSDESVARDGHTIASAGWQLDNFNANPVFLWCHDGNMPPIGKVVEIEKGNGLLRGTVEYADAETYAFADTIFRLTKGGFLNAVSVSWLPIDYERANQRERPGGIDFKRQELLEVSGVPIPALPTALATARAQGIDTQPLYDWAERILDDRSFAQGLSVPGRQLLSRSEMETLRKEAKMPGSSKRTLVEPVEPDLQMPPENQEKQPGTTRAMPALRRAALKRGLYEVAEMCWHLQSLEYLFSSIESEAAYEADGSPIPARFRAWMNEGNAILAAMCTEETSENIVDPETGEMIEDLIERSIARALAGVEITRSGKVLSKESRQALEDIHDHAVETCAMVRSFIDSASDKKSGSDDGATDDTGDDDVQERALRARRAKALSAKAA